MSFAFTAPNTLTPLLTAQQVVCAYPISDVYAATPRYLYYALIVASIVVRSRSWLATVFLGAAAAYAGTAAIEAFILIANQQQLPPFQQVSIPFVDGSSVEGNTTLAALSDLITDVNSIQISPAVMEFDIDAVLAITVTGYLVMLPMHCWSGTIRTQGARHLLIGIWNIMMLAGAICALVLWPSLDWNNFPNQYRFCYPQFPDDGSVSNDGWDDDLWMGERNATVWNTFANLTANFDLASSCLYPCFNTSAIMRQPSAITADLNVDKSPRTNANLSSRQYRHYDHLTTYMYVALALATFTALFLLLLNVTNLRRLTRVPVHKPQLLWTARKELWHSVINDAKILFRPTRHANKVEQALNPASKPRFQKKTTLRLAALARLLSDFFAFTVLIMAAVLIPVVNIAFIVWVEWFISHDIQSKETPQQVGQWSSLAAIGLVLVSAAVLRLRYCIASMDELQDDVERYREKVSHLEKLLAVKADKRTARHHREDPETGIDNGRHEDGHREK